MRLQSATVVGAALAATLLGGVVASAAVQPAAAPSDAVLTAPLSVDSATVPLPRSAPRSRPAPPRAAPAVAALADLHAPDLLVTVRTSLTDGQVAALRAVRGVSALAVVDAGTVKVGGRAARLLGVDPSAFRGLTPQETAASDPLWRAVARGELVPSYGLARARDLPLGGTVLVDGLRDAQLRVGAVAAFGLPGVDAVSSRDVAQGLGAVRSSAVLLSAPDRGLGALRRAVRDVLGRDNVVDVLRPEAVAPRAGRPASYRELYVDSARYCPGLSWTVLAAIGEVESGHGRHLGPSSAGALGPMQFLPSTWAAYGVDGDGDGRADILSPYDAVPSAARYLCRFGANRGPEGLYDAVFAYNHADWYVRKVLAAAARYA